MKKNTKKINNKDDNREWNKLKIKKSGFVRTIFQYYKLYPFLYTIAIIATLFSSLVTVIMPKITNHYLSFGFTNGNKIMQLAYILITLQVISGILLYFRNLCGSFIGVKVEIDYRNKLLKHLLNTDMSYYESKKIGESLTKLISDTQIISENMQAIPISFLSSLFTFIGGIVVIFSINWQMSLIVFGIVLLILVASIISVKIIRMFNYKWKKVYTAVNADITDRINNISLIKSNATQSSEMKRFYEEHLKYYNAARTSIQFESLSRAILITMLTGINTVGLITGLIFAKNGIIQYYTIIAFMLSVNTLIFPVIQSLQFLGNWARTSTSIIRVNEILNVKPTIINTPNAKIINKISQNVIFKNVSFKYKENGSWVIEKLSFIFEKGKSYAIVGATGVGKSTISKLLLRYYDPQEGQILINNTDLKAINLESYLHHVGYIEQDPQILYGDFLENISYSSQKAPIEKIIEAAKKANLHDYIKELPEKYHTILGERGINLSGGQKQRIAIARIFLKNPELLILDEATSALDNIIEKEIQAQFAKLMKNRTSIVIAHRLSTIKNVDQILVFEKHKGIVQTGKFKELKSLPGHFKNLYDAGLME